MILVHMRRWRFLLYAAAGAVALISALALSAPLFGNLGAVNAARWLFLSSSYKSKVLAQPVSASGELRHIEWDGWGWAGQDTTVYLVFEPTDALSVAAKSQQPSKFGGIPCEVYRVRRLESHWYTVQFYTNEFWGRRNALNCRGSETR
jgi:hypothetical protein